MNWESIGAIGELLGAVGVIGSVLYLAYQVKGARDATLANTRQMRQNGVRECMLTLADSQMLTPIFAKMGDPSPALQLLMEHYNLDREEANRVGAFNTAVMRQLETNLRMRMTQDEYEQTLSTLRNQISGPTGVSWQEAKSGYSTEFVRIVDALIAAKP